jgi:hypothetical protein
MYGNTTVRSALRLKDGLEALVASGLVGNLNGEANEIAFAEALDEYGVVSLSETTENVSSLGRKWRSALGKLGFIVGKLPNDALLARQDYFGREYSVTENGHRLLAAESVPAIQEVFLRAIAAVQVPSPFERLYPPPAFNPLRHVLRIMLALEDETGSSHITPVEMATIVQTTTPNYETNGIVQLILDLRERREASENKRAFDKDEREAAAVSAGVIGGTLRDYADTNFRYLRATGLLQGKGRGAALVPEQKTMAELLARHPDRFLQPDEYLYNLGKGESLPTDDDFGARVVLDRLVASAEERGIEVDLSGYDLTTAATIAIARHDVEAEISKSKEVDYAAEQAGRIDEILAVMQLLITRKAMTTVNGEEVFVPKDERPAYFEWVVWRAFLAINHLAVPPYEVRRFRIDQDFLPVGNAPGGGADLIAEFEDFVLVVEVTLTENSRQEAAEGEPVRRHVADVAVKHLETGKAVYGLFLANRIDSNTAETFRIGRWYLKNDAALTLDIAPFTLAQFRQLVASMFSGSTVHPNIIRDKIQAAIGMRHAADGAPEWKEYLEALIPVP